MIFGRRANGTGLRCLRSALCNLRFIACLFYVVGLRSCSFGAYMPDEPGAALTRRVETEGVARGLALLEQNAPTPPQV